MIAVSTFGLLRPLWLLGIPVIVFIAIYLSRRDGLAGAWRHAVDPDLLSAMERRGGLRAGSGKRQIAMLILALTILLALSGPALELADSSAFRDLDATLIIVDLSDAAGDDGRLEQERLTARAVADSIGTRQAGVLVYAGDAYMASTLTTDTDALGATISALEIDTVPDPGNRPARALSLAAQTLRDAGVVNADVILISAGSGFNAIADQQARGLVKAGYRLHTVLASPLHPSAEITERAAALASLAAAGHGIAATSLDFNHLLNDLRERPAERLAATSLVGLVWRDFGRAILVLAAAAALPLFRRSAP